MMSVQQNKLFLEFVYSSWKTILLDEEQYEGNHTKKNIAAKEFRPGQHRNAV